MMTNNKTVYAVILALCLLCAAIPAAGAAPRSLGQTPDNLTEPFSVAAVEESLYVLNGGLLYRTVLATDAHEKPALLRADLNKNSRIASLNGALYLLSYENQRFSLDRLEGEMLSCMPCGEPLEAKGFFFDQVEQDHALLVDFAILTETSWAALLRRGPGKTALLYGDHDSKTVREVCPGTVTAVASAGEHSVIVMLDTGELKRIELPAGRQTVLAQLDGSAYALAATESGDTLFMADDQRVYRYTKETGVQAYDRSPLVFQEMGLPACVVGETYVLGDHMGLFAVEPPDMSIPVLSIAGYEDRQILQRFEEQHRFRVIPFNEGVYYDVSQLMQDIITQNDSYDLYTIEVSTGCLSILLQKGYAVPLDTSTTLVSVLDGMDPKLTSLLRQDQRYAAFPKHASVNVLCINTDTMRAFGLTQEDMPRTFSDFLPWLARQAETARELGLALTDNNFSLRRMAFGLLMDLYVEQCEKEHMWPDFQSFQFPELLAQIDQCFPDNMPMPLPEAGDSEIPFPLLSQQDVGQGWPVKQGWIPLFLRLSEDTEPIITVQITAYIINPYSKNKEGALAYLEYVSTWMDDETRLLLSQTPIAPVKDPAVIQEIQLLEEEKERLTQVLASPEPQDQDAMQRMLEDIDAQLRGLEDRKWIISPEDIQRVECYRPSFHLRGEATFFASATGTIGRYSRQFSDGTINAPEMLRMLQRLAQMIQLESSAKVKIFSD